MIMNGHTCSVETATSRRKTSHLPIVVAEGRPTDQVGATRLPPFMTIVCGRPSPMIGHITRKYLPIDPDESLGRIDGPSTLPSLALPILRRA